MRWYLLCTSVVKLRLGKFAKASLCFEIGSHYVTQADLELTHIYLPSKLIKGLAPPLSLCFSVCLVV